MTLLEVRSPGQAQSDIFILEIASYPDARVPSQAVRDTALVYLQRGIVPELIVLLWDVRSGIAVMLEISPRQIFDYPAPHSFNLLHLRS